MSTRLGEWRGNAASPERVSRTTARRRSSCATCAATHSSSATLVRLLAAESAAVICDAELYPKIHENLKKFF
jgi:hypothetical protein